ncbi:MAG TPA: hypothetical protein VLG16_01890 [Candidatus Saccharimonadales bacterium]|nr:hypothetical protein [Candidatus Saccharimonadales bacterium]
MPPLVFYPAFIGTFISVVAWTYLAYKEHLPHLPRTLSELAAEKAETLRYYRTILWVCGPLFAVTLYLFIVPRIASSLLAGVIGSFTIIPELLIGYFPAKRGKITAHDIIAGTMGAGMITLAYMFAWDLYGLYSLTELVLAIVISALGILCIANRKRYLFYELPLIYLPHFSILVAALALK